MNENPIGIFDSGVGGLTVLKEIKRQLPNESIIYLGDTYNFPYGNKTKDEIINFSRINVQRLIKLGVKLIVIACGTATSQALNVLKDEFNIPIIGIINPTVKYVKDRNISKIGVIATQGTIRSGAWEKELKLNIENIQVINKACPMLATIAEEGRALSDEGIKVIKEYMKPFKENKIDKIILGCTHYPIYEELIKKEFEYEIELINTGTTVAKYLDNYLEINNLKNKTNIRLENAYLTKSETSFKELAKNVFDFNTKIEEIK